MRQSLAFLFVSALLTGKSSLGWSLQRNLVFVGWKALSFRGPLQTFPLPAARRDDGSPLSENDAAGSEEFDRRLETPPSSQQVANRMPQRSASTRDMMSALGTSPRRIFLSTLSASGIALAGNLFGVTSQLLMAFPEEQVAASGLDTYFPRGPYKRYRTADYSLVIPTEWVADTAVELAKAQERTMSLDYSMRVKSNAVLPDAAFGPPGNLLDKNGAAGDMNVSIIKTPAPAQFDIRQVMTQNQSSDPTAGAQFLLQNFLAGRGRQVTLLSVSGNDNASLLGSPSSSTTSTMSSASYRFSYRVDRDGSQVPLQAISIIAQKYANPGVGESSVLYTFTEVAPTSVWESDFASKLEKVADSFRLN